MGVGDNIFLPLDFCQLMGPDSLASLIFAKGHRRYIFFGGKAGHMSKPLAHGEFAVVA